MDATGYRDADTLLEELSEAMNVKISNLPSASSTPPPAALIKVESALSNGTFGQLKAHDPKAASEGLRLLVSRLGASNESDFRPVARLLQKAGRDAFPALPDGMGHRTLAVRVRARKVLQSVVSKEDLQGQSFDPWAPRRFERVN